MVQNNNNYQSWLKIQTVVFWFLSALKDDHNVWKITKFWFWDKENGLKFQSNMSINGNHKRFKVVYNTILIQFGLPAGV